MWEDVVFGPIHLAHRFGDHHSGITGRSAWGWKSSSCWNLHDRWIKKQWEHQWKRSAKTSYSWNSDGRVYFVQCHNRTPERLRCRRTAKLWLRIHSKFQLIMATGFAKDFIRLHHPGASQNLTHTWIFFLLWSFEVAQLAHGVGYADNFHLLHYNWLWFYESL